MGKKRTEKIAKKSAPATVQPVSRFSWQPGAPWIPLALVLAVTFVVFLPSLSNDFVNWDDDRNVYGNANLEAFDWAHVKAIFTSTVIGGYNPLTILTFALEKHFFGLNPKVFHFDNLLLHLICVVLVYRLLLKLNLSTWAAALGALLFGIHPMRVESVAWVTERKDVLYGAFYLAALLVYVRYLRENYAKKFFWLALVLFIFSLFAKIQAVALPLSLLAVDYYFKRPPRLKLLVEKIPFFALSLLVGGLGIVLLSHAKTLHDIPGYGLAARLLIGAYSFCIYLVKFVAPYELAPLYPYPGTLPREFYLAPPLVIGLAGFLVWAYRRTQIAIVFGFAFFIVNIVFVLQILGAGQGFLADRFSYLPYFGLIFLVTKLYDALVSQPATRTIVRWAAGVYLSVLAVMTWNQCHIWKNSETLWTHVIKDDPQIAMPYGNRAFYRRNHGQIQQALDDYEKGLRFAKNKSALHNSRGKLFFDIGQTEKAIAEYTAAIKEKPEFAEAYINRGAAYAKLKQYDVSLADLNRGLELDPNSAEGYFNRTFLYAQTKKFELAMPDYDAYLKLKPSNAAMWYERALAKGNLARHAESIPDFNAAIRLEPAKGIYYLERSRAYRSLGKMREALADAQTAKARGAPVEESYLQMLEQGGR